VLLIPEFEVALVAHKSQLHKEIQQFDGTGAESMERYLFLKDNSVCAVIKHANNEGNTLIALSPAGRHVKVYHEGQWYQHLTRFVPGKFEDVVAKVLNYRNRFAGRQYLCSRFAPEREFHSNIATATLVCEHNQMLVLLCPLLQRIHIIRKVYTMNEDNCMEHRFSTAGLNKLNFSEVGSTYPIRRIPLDVQRCIVSAASATLHDTKSSSIAVAPEETDSARCAAECLDALMTSMAAVAVDGERYLTPHSATERRTSPSFPTLTMVESVDGDLFMVSHDGRTGPRTTHEEQSRRLLVHILSVLLQRAGATAEEGEALLGTVWESKELEVECWLEGSTRASPSHMPGDIVLRLKGDYFTFIHRTAEGLCKDTLHSSHLHHEMQRQAHMLELGDNNEVIWTDDVPDPSLSDRDGARALLRLYYKQALRLVRYREHVLQQSRGLEYPYGDIITCAPPATVATVQPASTSTVSRTLQDGSTLTALLKLCQHSGEAAPYLLSLADVPVNAHFFVGGRPAPAHLVDNRAYPAHCVTHISATFPDHTIMKFDLQTQVRQMNVWVFACQVASLQFTHSM
jgi:hypothetical protein